MKRIAVIASLLFGALLTMRGTAAEDPLVMDVWPGRPADDDAATIGEEHFRELIVNGKPYQVAGKPTKWLTNVTKPTLTVYRPAKDKNIGTAMLICPGGGYHNLGWDVEGEEIAAWLNSLGITGIILKYRCPRRPGDAKGEPPLGPLKDAQRAVSLVRSKAEAWGIDPNRIGMIGFSAGGHLVGATATNFEKRSYEPIDAIDRISCRPDFAIPVYSGYFNIGNKGEQKLSPTVRLPANAPPILFVHASDDSISDVEHSVTFYLALKRASIHADLHVYASGGHGFGVRPTNAACSAWTQACVDWLRNRGFLRTNAKE
jgi:acetyl esterase/lipase